MQTLKRAIVLAFAFTAILSCGGDDGTGPDDTDVAVAQMIASADDFTCAVDAAGIAYCWGSNEKGALGNSGAADPTCGEVGDHACIARPVRVSGTHIFAKIYAGRNVACALTRIGEAFCWGQNTFGASATQQTSCPDGVTTDCILVPTTSFGALRFSSLSLAGDLCGILFDGQIMCALGAAPVTVNQPSPLVSLTGGGATNCGLTAFGKAFCWGDNSTGQLGTNSVSASAAPVAVHASLTFRSITVGAGGFVCGATTLRAAFCWGRNQNGTLGNGTITADNTCRDNTVPCTITPMAVVGGHLFDGVSAGNDFACGWVNGGAAYCWGRDVPTDGAGVEVSLTCTPVNCSPTPLKVAGTLRFGAIISGAIHACSLASGGGVYCWGNNAVGQLGGGTDGASAIGPAGVRPFN